MAVVQEGEASASASAFGLETIFGNRFIYTGQRLPIQPSGAYQRRPHYAHQNGQFGQQLIDEVRALNPRCSFFPHHDAFFVSSSATATRGPRIGGRGDNRASASSGFRSSRLSGRRDST